MWAAGQDAQRQGPAWVVERQRVGGQDVWEYIEAWATMLRGGGLQRAGQGPGPQADDLMCDLREGAGGQRASAALSVPIFVEVRDAFDPEQATLTFLTATGVGEGS
jgi:hypothetical protein